MNRSVAIEHPETPRGSLIGPLGRPVGPSPGPLPVAP